MDPRDASIHKNNIKDKLLPKWFCTCKFQNIWIILPKGKTIKPKTKPQQPIQEFIPDEIDFMEQFDKGLK